MAEPSLELIQRLCEEALAEVKGMRAEMRDVRSTVLQSMELSRRIERRVGEVDRRVGDVERRVGEVDRRIDELKDDIERMLKIEIGGRFAHVETRLERYAEDVVDARLREAGKFGEAVRPDPAGR